MEVVPFRDEFKDAVVQLWGHDKDASYVKNKSIVWDWLYGENPHADKAPSGMVVVDGEVLAFIGMLPVMLKYRDRLVEAHWTLDGIMDPKCRGKGYGFKLYDAAVKACKYVHIGIGMNDITEHLLVKTGCVSNDEVEQYVFTKRPDGLKGAAKKAVQQMGVLKNLPARPPTEGLEARVVPGGEMPVEVDALWDRVAGGYDKIVVRDYAYMHWKYSRHPLAKYQLVVVESGGELAGVGVFRKGAAKALLVDYVGPADDPAVKYLIASTFKRACSDAEFLHCISSDRQLGKALESVGFRRYREKERFYVYSAIEGDVDCEKNWFIMGGESDADVGDHLQELQSEGR